MNNYDIINASNTDGHDHLVVDKRGGGSSEVIARCDRPEHAHLIKDCLNRCATENAKANAGIKFGVAVEPSVTAADQQFDPEPANYLIIEKVGDLTKITIRI